MAGRRKSDTLATPSAFLLPAPRGEGGRRPDEGRLGASYSYPDIRKARYPQTPHTATMPCTDQEHDTMRGPQPHTREHSLRRYQTEAEKKLWQHLRNRRLLGYKFRRQHRIDRFYPDFICLQARLIVELDGSQHLDQQAYDDARTQRLQQLGYRVLRLWNDDVLLRIDDALAAIAAALTAAPHPSLRATFSPPCGEKG